MTNPAIWSCKIGEVDRAKLPHGSDLPMRDAVRTCYRALTGAEPDFIFSGWAAKLDESERAVVEDRLPDPEVIRDELVARLETLPVAWQDDTPADDELRALRIAINEAEHNAALYYADRGEYEEATVEVDTITLRALLGERTAHRATKVELERVKSSLKPS